MPGDIEFIDPSKHSRPIRSLPRAGPSSRNRARRTAPSIPSGDVIEITDSEDEAPQQRQSLFASSSSVWEVPPPESSQPLFFPDPDEPVAGPSSSPKRTQPAHPPPSLTPSLVLEDAMNLELPAPAEESDPFDAYVAQVLEIVPDVDPSHVLTLIVLHHEDYKDKVVEPVLHNLFENPGYPKLDKGKGKRKREEAALGVVSKRRVSEVGIDYADMGRKRPSGRYYQDLAIARLSIDFPSAPTQHIRREFKRHNSLYAPTYIAFDAEIAMGALSYTPLLVPRTESVQSKGKAIAKQDPDFDLELEYIRNRRAREDEEVAEQLHKESLEECEGAGIECGCCFTENPFDDMIQCPDAHLFCKTCMTAYAETKLGEHDASILCMDQSDCKLAFSESELRRLLTPKLLALYERIKQRKEIEAAGLENLEECPFCEYKVVIENDQEKLFRCDNTDCGAVSCRSCKKLDHLPKSCKEVEEDKKLDVRHAIEEAMSAALMRNCPKCGKGFLKESGCNKMICPNCQTMSCYVCRKAITGYEHFNQAPPYSNPVDKSKCPLWDPVEQRHADEVTAAAKKAMEEFKQAHPEMDEKDMAVELPKAPPPNPGVHHPGIHLPVPAVVVPQVQPARARAHRRGERAAAALPQVAAAPALPPVPYAYVGLPPGAQFNQYNPLPVAGNLFGPPAAHLLPGMGVAGPGVANNIGMQHNVYAPPQRIPQHVPQLPYIGANFNVANPFGLPPGPQAPPLAPVPAPLPATRARRAQMAAVVMPPVPAPVPHAPRRSGRKTGRAVRAGTKTGSLM